MTAKRKRLSGAGAQVATEVSINFGASLAGLMAGGHEAGHERVPGEGEHGGGHAHEEDAEAEGDGIGGEQTDHEPHH